MRVTIDVDGGELDALIKLLNLIHYTSMFPRVKYELYKTRRGYHIVARDLPITFEQSLLIRMMVGDDQTRIMLDEADGAKPRQVLFTWKRGRGPRKPLNIMEFISGISRGRDHERDTGYIGLHIRAQGNRPRGHDKTAITLAKQHNHETPARAKATRIHIREI